MDVGATSSIGQLATHLLVETGHHRLTAVVLQVVAVTRRNRSTIGRTDTQHVCVHALVLSILGGL